MKAFVCFIAAAILLLFGVLRSAGETPWDFLSSALFGAAGAMTVIGIEALAAIA